jgi:hypothetical protein
MVSIDEGIQIDAKDKQCEKAELPSVESLLSTSNVTFDRFSHWTKQQSAMVSIDAGI